MMLIRRSLRPRCPSCAELLLLTAVLLPACHGSQEPATAGTIGPQLVLSADPSGSPRTFVTRRGDTVVYVSRDVAGEQAQEQGCTAVAAAEFSPHPGLETLFECGASPDQLEPLVLQAAGGELLWARELEYAVTSVHLLDLVADPYQELMLGCTGLHGYYVALKWREQGFEEIFSRDLGGLTALALIPDAAADDLFGHVTLEGRTTRQGETVTLFRWQWDPQTFRYRETYRREAIEGLDPAQLRSLDPATRDTVSRLIRAIPDDDRPTFLQLVGPEGFQLDGQLLSRADLERRLVDERGLLPLLQVVSEEPPLWRVTRQADGELRLIEQTTDRFLRLVPQPGQGWRLTEVGPVAPGPR